MLNSTTHFRKLTIRYGDVSAFPLSISIAGRKFVRQRGLPLIFDTARDSREGSPELEQWKSLVGSNYTDNTCALYLLVYNRCLQDMLQGDTSGQ